jgi:hypothetical protein
MTQTTEAHGTLLDAVGRAKHTLQAQHSPDAARVTVHGVCPIAECRAMTVLEVHADTDTVTCSECGTAFDV